MHCAAVKLVSMATPVDAKEEVPEAPQVEKESASSPEASPEKDLVKLFDETVSANEATFVVFYRGLW